MLFDGVTIPKVRTLISLPGSATVDPQAGFLQLGKGPSLGTGQLAGPVWTEIPAELVAGISLKLGQSGEIDQVSPATAQITIDNFSGDWDPQNLSSPYNVPNLLDRTDSNFEGGIGSWAAGGGGDVTAGTAAAEGNGSLKLTADGTAIMWAKAPGSAVAVTAGQQVTVGVLVKSASASRSWRAVVRWLDTSMAYNSQSNGATTAADSGGFTQLQASGTAPVDGYALIQLESLTTPANGEVWHADQAQLSLTASLPLWAPGGTSGLDLGRPVWIIADWPAAAAGGGGGGGGGSPAFTYDVLVQPGDSNAAAQAKINGSGSTAVIGFAAGVHYERKITPKLGQTLRGDPGGGTIFDGSRLVTGWTGSAPWVASHTVANRGVTIDTTGQRTATGDDVGSQYPEELWFETVADGQTGWTRKQRQGTPSTTAPSAGKWTMDYASGTLRVAENPTSVNVRISVTDTAVVPPAFGPGGLVLEDLTIRKYATDIWHSAAGSNGDHRDWTYRRCAFIDSHGSGMALGPGDLVQGCKVGWQGFEGFTNACEAGGYTAAQTITDTEVCYNKRGRYRWDWEGGGSKFDTPTSGTGLQIRNCWWHHNQGPAIWLDLNETETSANVIESCLIEDNEIKAIFNEISNAAGGTMLIRWNEIRNNGTGSVANNGGTAASTGDAATAVDISNSRGTTVTANRIEDNNHSVIVRDDDRSPFLNGCSVDHNSIKQANGQIVIKYRPGVGATRIATCGADFNSYWVTASSSLWNYNLTTYTFAGWQAARGGGGLTGALDPGGTAGLTGTVTDPAGYVPFVAAAAYGPGTNASPQPAADVSFPLFYGTVTSIVPTYGQEPTVTIGCQDGFEQLGRAGLAQISPSFDGDLSGVRLGRILDAVGYPSSLRALDPGLSPCQATSYGDQALPLAQAVVDTELGRLFIDGNGIVTFYDRLHVYTAARSTTVQATISDTGSDVDMVDVDMVKDGALLFTAAQVTRDGGTQQTAIDPAAVSAYGLRTFPGSVGALLRTDADALSLASWLVGKYKVPQVRVQQITIAAATAAMWTQILPLRMLDRVLVVRDYGPVTISRQELVEGVEHEISQDAWTVTLHTSDPFAFSPMILEQPPGLGTGQLA
jgi:hypothetical protein